MTRASDLAKLLGAGATINDGTTITTADNTAQLTLTSTDADASTGPNLVLQRDSSSPADNDLAGTVKFKADNDAGEATDLVSIFSRINDASDGTEDASLLVNSIVGGSQISRFNITPTEIAINDDSIDSDFRVESNGNANMLFVDGGNDRVGIGTNSPSYQIDAGSGTTVNQRLRLQRGSDDTNQFATFGWLGIQVHRSNVALSSTQTNMKFEQVGSDGTRTSMMIDGAGGNFLVKKTAHNFQTAGFQVEQSSGETVATRSGGTPLVANRLTNDGEIFGLYSDNSAVGSMSVFAGRLCVGAGDTALKFDAGNDSIMPFNIGTGGNRDDAVDLGYGGVRFDDIFATNTSITTSDKNEKQDIEELTDAEKRVAVVAKGLLRKYRWKSSVAEKGDKARTHFGIIAQDLEDAFTAESLDATKYAMFCSDTWWEKEISVDAVEAVEEVIDEEGTLITRAVEARDAYTYIDTKQEATEGYTSKTRLGVRYSELLAFIISAI